MIKVQLRPGEALEAALRRFKRQCNYAGVFRLSKRNAYYEKPSDRRRREERERVRNVQRNIRKLARAKTKARSRGPGARAASPAAAAKEAVPAVAT
jgi:small subunit ribosomal protein S21